MEENDFDLDRWEKEAQREDELFHVGIPLLEELNRIHPSDDNILINEFFERLTPVEPEALQYITNRQNQALEQLEQLLKDRNRQATDDFQLSVPAVFKPAILKALNRHEALYKRPSTTRPNRQNRFNDPHEISSLMKLFFLGKKFTSTQWLHLALANIHE